MAVRPAVARRGGAIAAAHDLARRNDAARRSPGGRCRRRIDQRQSGIVDLQDRQRASRHLERRQEVAHPGTLDREPVGRAAAAIARRATIASSISGVPPSPFTSRATRSAVARREIGEDRTRAGARPGRRPAEDRALDTLLAMDAEAELDLLSPSSNPGRPTAGTVQAPSATPMLAESPAAARASAATSARARPAAAAAPAILWIEHRAGDAAATIARHGAGQRHVVGDHDDLDRNALGARQLGGEAEVQPVAGVVLDHQHRAGRYRRQRGWRPARHRRWAR